MTESKSLPASKDPVGPGAITQVGLFLALCVVVLGAIAIRDSLIAFDAIKGGYWLVPAGNWIDGVRHETWMIPAGIVAALFGLWLVILSVKPRPTVGTALEAERGMSIETASISRIVEEAVNDVDGVLSVKAKTTGGRVKVSAKATGTDSTIEADVREKAEKSLVGLANAPKVIVKLREGVSE